MGLDDFAFGIDISQYQSSQNGKILQDFDALANHSEKVSFIFARAGISWGYKDPCFDYYWAEMARIGVCRGAYHYLYPSQSVKRQMDWFLSITSKRTEHDRLALDLETTNGLYRQQVTDFLNNCLEYLKQRTGRYPILYSRKTWLDPYVDMRQVPEVDLWIARYASIPPGKKYAPEYPTPPELPNHTHNWLIHQVGDKMPPIGCQSKTMDYDRWNGDEAAVRAYFGYTGEEPEPPEPPAEEVPLYKAVVVTTPPNRLRVRFSPAGNFKRWLQSGEEVDIYQELGDWRRIEADGWSAAEWLQRIDETPPGEGENIFYSQRDPRWGEDYMGASIIKMKNEGCLVTATAALLTRLGFPETPGTYNDKASRQGGYQYPNLMYWNFPHILYPQIVKSEDKSFSYGTGFESYLNNILNDGRDALGMVDFIPGGTFNQHWVRIYKREGGLYYLHDPWYGNSQALNARYHKLFRIVGYRRTA